MKKYRCLMSLCIALCVSYIQRTISLELFVSILVAVLVHEAGHIVAIYTNGMKVSSIKVELSGLKISYNGDGLGTSDLVSVLAGPIAGIIYFFVADKCLNFPYLSAELSLLYSIFNLLPVFPLDGGRAMLIISEKVFGEDGQSYVRQLSKVFCAIFLLLGLLCFLMGEGGALFASGVWLLIMQNEK